MIRRTWPVFTLGLSSLLLLVLVPGVATIRRTDRIQEEIRRIQENYQRGEQALDDVSGRIQIVSITVRDFLLDSSPQNGARYLSEVDVNRTAIEERLDFLRNMLAPEDVGPYQRLRSELARYWESVLPVFKWTPEQRQSRATYFLRQQQRPRRETLLTITAELAKLNRSNFQHQYADLYESLRVFRRDAEYRFTLSALGGLGIAIATVFGMAHIERRNREHQATTAAAEREMRELSTRLMHAQEEERRSISRELHDEVGQMLTGLRMELGSLERGRLDEARFVTHVQEAKELAEQTMRTVRDLARGLRPSVLDDLGLGAALQWQAREFSRRTNIKVRVDLSNEAETLADTHRTCLYRVVQEALTNCAKHANATEIAISLGGTDETVSLTVQDNGVGMKAGNGHDGLGLVGIEERVRELGGTLIIKSEPGHGTTIRAHIPFVREATA